MPLHLSDPYAYLKRKLGITEVIAGIANLRDLITQLPEKIIMAIRPEIQALLDAIGPLVTAVQNLETQTAAETATIADLTAKVASGATLSPEEVTALAGAAKTVSDLTAGVIAAAQPVPAAAAAATP